MIVLFQKRNERPSSHRLSVDEAYCRTKLPGSYHKRTIIFSICFAEAIKSCESHSDFEENGCKNFFALLENFASFEISIGNHVDAHAMLSQKCTDRPDVKELWLLFLTTTIRSGDEDTIPVIAEKALKNCRYNAEISHIYSSWLVSKVN